MKLVIYVVVGLFGFFVGVSRGRVLVAKGERTKIFSTKGMTERPRFYEMFRVGPDVGLCICSTPWFVTMRLA